MAIDLAMVAGLTGVMRSGLLVQRLHDRRASAGLRAVDLEVAVDQAELAQLAEGLRHLGQDGSARGRDDDVLRQLPAELLGDLEAVRLGAPRCSTGRTLMLTNAQPYLSATSLHRRFTSS
jgi:hypothetical protein